MHYTTRFLDDGTAIQHPTEGEAQVLKDALLET
jgi:hypothetical protein